MTTSKRGNKTVATITRNAKGQLATERVADLPHANLAEEVVLGLASLSIDQYEKARSMGLETSHFFVAQHQEVWASIEAVATRDRDVTPLAVASHLRQEFGWDEKAALKALTSYANGTSLAMMGGESPARIIIDFAGKRDALAFARELTEAASNGKSTLEILKMTETWASEQEKRTPLKFEAQGPRPLGMWGEFPPIQWFVGDDNGPLLPYGYPSMLVADGGLGKSTMALLIAIIAAMGGGDWLGFPVQGGRACYLDFELDPRPTQWRARQIMRALYGIDGLPDNLDYVACREEGISLSDSIIKLEGWIKEHGYKFVVFDSLSIAMAEDPSNPQAVIDLLNRKMKYLSRYETSVLFLDHKPKAQPGQDSNDRGAYGSVFKRNIGRSIIHVSGEKINDSQKHLTFTHNKSNFGTLLDPWGAILTITKDGGIKMEPAAPDVNATADRGPSISDNAEKILKFLAASGLTQSNATIADESGVGKGSVATLLARMQEMALVEKVGRGAWKITDKGRVAIGLDPTEAAENSDGVDKLLRDAFGGDPLPGFEDDDDGK